ncbi:hypothetical protein N2152v2_005251 [Parachlorella kessleri]
MVALITVQCTAVSAARSWRLRRVHQTFGPPLVGAPCHPRLGALPQATQQSLSTLDVEDLSNDYCDDFVCNSSPAVENTIRAFAKDLQRCNGTWTRSLLARTVEYKDAFRSCRGRDGYQRLNFVSSKVKGAKVQVTRLRMLDNGTAVVSWRVQGSLGALPLALDVDMDSQLSLNLVTGLIEKRSDKWDLSRCSPPAALAWTVSRMLWSAQQASLDAKEGTGRVLSSLNSMDSEDADIQLQRSPTDPTKFFQQNDNTMQDAFLFSAFVALLWVVAQAYGQIFSL